MKVTDLFQSLGYFSNNVTFALCTEIHNNSEFVADIGRSEIKIL